jgi:hypothetical protein
MRRAAAITLAVALWFGPAASRADEPNTISLRWSELSTAVDDRKVALVLPDGTEVQGRVRQVEADGLRLKVSKTSNRNVVPKGNALIPRQSVSVIRVTDYRKLARILCTAGAVAASALVVVASDIDVYEGPALIIVPAVSVAGAIGAGVGGYYIGKRIDKRLAYVRVVPE